eukprot:COSAG01_NODE_67215_length_267_cov_2.125000_1_plen_46_part_10
MSFQKPRSLFLKTQAGIGHRTKQLGGATMDFNKAAILSGRRIAVQM